MSAPQPLPRTRLLPQVDAKNERAWGSWIVMERDLGFQERADELEIKLNENRWVRVGCARVGCARTGGARVH